MSNPNPPPPPQKSKQHSCIFILLFLSPSPTSSADCIAANSATIADLSVWEGSFLGSVNVIGEAISATGHIIDTDIRVALLAKWEGIRYASESLFRVRERLREQAASSPGTSIETLVLERERENVYSAISDFKIAYEAAVVNVVAKANLLHQRYSLLNSSPDNIFTNYITTIQPSLDATFSAIQLLLPRRSNPDDDASEKYLPSRDTVEDALCINFDTVRWRWKTIESSLADLLKDSGGLPLSSDSLDALHEVFYYDTLMTTVFPLFSSLASLTHSLTTRLDFFLNCVKHSSPSMLSTALTVGCSTISSPLSVKLYWVKNQENTQLAFDTLSLPLTPTHSLWFPLCITHRVTLAAEAVQTRISLFEPEATWPTGVTKNLHGVSQLSPAMTDGGASYCFSRLSLFETQVVSVSFNDSSSALSSHLLPVAQSAFQHTQGTDTEEAHSVVLNRALSMSSTSPLLFLSDDVEATPVLVDDIFSSDESPLTVWSLHPSAWYSSTSRVASASSSPFTSFLSQGVCSSLSSEFSSPFQTQ